MTTLVSPGNIGLPPPTVRPLFDRNRGVGWVAGTTVGFLGFANEAEAADAAWVAYRTLTQRLARRDGTRPIPIGTEPLTIRRRGDRREIVASGRVIGTLVRGNAEHPDIPSSFGFEVQVPQPADEQDALSERSVKAKADLMYRTLRKSGIRWAMWGRDPAPPTPGPVERPARADRSEPRTAQARRPWPSWITNARSLRWLRASRPRAVQHGARVAVEPLPARS